MSDIKMVFDTNCVLCSGFVKFILRHEQNPEIIFVNAWSAMGLSLAKQHGLNEAKLHKTYLVVSGNKGFIKSDAGFEIIRHLKHPWRWLVILRFIPRVIRDGLYSLIAKNRYKWFGYEESCLVPPQDMLHRFIDV